MTTTANTTAKVQDVLNKACSAEDGPPGLVFGMCNRDGTILVEGAAGLRGLNNPGEPMTTDTAFVFFSCTKLITGMACMQLVEKGELILDDPVENILPEIKEVKMLDGSTPRNKITLRMLLSHTAGFDYTFLNNALHKHCKPGGETDGTAESTYNQPLVAQPGEDWHYGVNIDWAGRALERVTGLTLGEYCQKHILEPLGCRDTGFDILPRVKNRLAGMHQRSAAGKIMQREHLPMTIPGSDFHSGGAGCIGTLEDYLKILTVLINNGKGANGAQILKPETVEEMWKDQLNGTAAEKNQALYRTLPAAIPELMNATDMSPGMKKGWAIPGLLTYGPWPTGRRSNSIWWAGLANLFWMVDREAGLCSMILSQIFPFNDPMVLGAWLEAEKIVYDDHGLQKL